MKQITIRNATSADAERLVEIYAPYVENTAITFEYDVPSIAAFSERIQNISARYPYFVAIDNDTIVGYAYATQLGERKAFSWAVETAIYLDQSYHGGGIGKKLYTALEKALVEQGITNMYARIVSPHPQSIGFHTSFGFKTAGLLHACGFKLGKWHDLVYMEKQIAELAIPPKERP